MFSIISKSKNMQFVAQGATAGVGGCQTLGQVSEQMDSLLDRQSSQRILPNESCLLAKGESRVQCHKRVTHPGDDTQVAKNCSTTRAHSISAKDYSPHME